MSKIENQKKLSNRLINKINYKKKLLQNYRKN